RISFGTRKSLSSSVTRHSASAAQGRFMHMTWLSESDCSLETIADSFTTLLLVAIPPNAEPYDPRGVISAARPLLGAAHAERAASLQVGRPGDATSILRACSSIGRDTHIRSI